MVNTLLQFRYTLGMVVCFLALRIWADLPRLKCTPVICLGTGGDGGVGREHRPWGLASWVLIPALLLPGLDLGKDVTSECLSFLLSRMRIAGQAF